MSKNNLLKYCFKEYGIANNISRKIIYKSGFNLRVGINKLTEAQKYEISQAKNSIKKQYNKKFGKALKDEIKNAHSLLLHIKSRRGIRNKMGLPSRGQRTHTNANTKKKMKYETFDIKKSNDKKAEL
jgi:small subunit ribosomal protein S13